MAITHINGFGTLPVSGDYVFPLNAASGTSTYTRETGRYGGYALRHRNATANAGSGYVARLSLPPLTEFAVGIAINHRATHSPGGNLFGFQLEHSAATTNVQLGTNVANTYGIATGTAAWSILDPSVTSVGWHWWCWLYRYHATTGLNQVYRDGVLLAQQTADTVPSAGVLTSVYIYLGNDNGGAQADLGDLIVRNDATAIGDSVVSSLFPTGTSAAAWIGSDGNSSDNHLLIDEAPTYDAADYVGSATVGAVDTYTLGDLPNTAGTVHAVQVGARAFKSDAGAKTLRTRINAQNGTALDPGGAKTIYHLTTTSDGSAAWTTATINAATASVEVVS